MDSGDQLQLNTTGTNYTTISHLAIAGASVSMNGTSATVTPALPSIAEVSGLTAALAGKVDDGQVLTNMPSGATFDYPEIWTGAGNTDTRMPRSSTSATSRTPLAWD